MWPFGKKRISPAQPELPRGLKRPSEEPMGVLFTYFVMDLLGALPAEQESRLEAMALHRVFGQEPCNWRQAIASTLHLRETFPIAVMDLWYKNSDIALASGPSYSAAAFAADFVDQYLAPDSKVDQWPPGTLDQARAFVASRQQSPAGA